MRKNDWQARFSEFVAARRDLPFVWGQNDCCLFAADCVLALTGADPAAPLRGYETALEAARLVDGMGGMHALACGALGAPVAPSMAAVGDVVLLINEGREMLAISNGTTAIAPGELGMAVLSMESAQAVWKI